MRAGANGHVAVVAGTAALCSSWGVLVAPNGDLWILEYFASSQVRVRRITENGRSSVC
jgi:hypothetical protein